MGSLGGGRERFEKNCRGTFGIKPNQWVLSSSMAVLVKLKTFVAALSSQIALQRRRLLLLLLVRVTTVSVSCQLCSHLDT
ncbi:hypothetical protein ACFX2I_027358 [Malus domestica]